MYEKKRKTPPPLYKVRLSFITLSWCFLPLSFIWCLPSDLAAPPLMTIFTARTSHYSHFFLGDYGSSSHGLTLIILHSLSFTFLVAPWIYIFIVGKISWRVNFLYAIGLFNSTHTCRQSLFSASKWYSTRVRKYQLNPSKHVYLSEY